MTPSSESKDIFTAILGNLKEKYEELTDYRNNISWKFFQGKAPEAYKLDFDSSSWDTVTLPLRFDARKGEAWLRCKVTIPEEVQGIKTQNSMVKLSSSAILDKSDIYVDERKVLSAEYWMELRAKIVLDERAEPGREHVIAIHLFPKAEPVDIPEFHVMYSNVEKIAFEIDSFIQEIRFASFLDEKFARSVLEEFDSSVFKRDLLSLIDEIEKARSKLSALSQKSKEFKVHLVAHAHIDMNWLWPWEDTVNTVRDTFSTMVKLMDTYGDFCFSQSQAVTYKIVEDNSPKIFEKIREYAGKGNWDITASMWVEADLNMAGTEALIRQFLYARRYIDEKFNVKPKICWEPDTFGHIWTLPQILRKSGIKYYYFMRCGKGHPLFWWEGPDGSRVLAFTSVYNNTVTPKNIVDLAVDLYERYGLKISMFVYGAGNHGGGATIEDIEAAYEIRKKPTMPDVLFSSAQKFFEDAERKIEEKSLSVPTINDELQFTFDGCYTTHGDIKRYNRLCEALLVDAEILCSLADIYHQDRLRETWLKMLFNQFHDILDGSGSAEAYVYPRMLAQEVIEASEEIINSAIKTLSDKIDFSKDGLPVVVFNTLSWDRLDVVKVRIPKNLIPQNPVAVSYDGRYKSPVQVHGDELTFLAHVPPVGYITYYIVEGDASEEPFLAKDDNVLENEHFRLEINKSSGTIRTLYDKMNKRFVFKEDRYQFTRPVLSNLMQVLYEVPHPMSAWIIGEISRIENLRNAEIEPFENGPVKGTVKVKWKYHNSEINQYISLYKDLPRIDFYTIINWQEVSDDETEAPMLKVSFTPILDKSKAFFEIPFAYIERTPDGTEVPALRWVDLSDEEYGLSLINNCKYGFDVKGYTVRMTLIRTSYSPDPRPDQGVHEITYSLYPHRGDWKKSMTFRVGYELNRPLKAYPILARSESECRLSEPEERSLLKVKPDNVVISCIKNSEDSNDIVIRLYDATGEGAESEVQFNFRVGEVYETDLMENPMKALKFQDGKVSLRLKQFEIKTMRVKH
ncbi:alpha-mannosidase [Candidatus Bathyarchaeota archaeon]|nr:alpha-mannosidase [Candidatus Bathyarchaeota archaeon]